MHLFEWMHLLEWMHLVGSSVWVDVGGRWWRQSPKRIILISELVCILSRLIRYYSYRGQFWRCGISRWIVTAIFPPATSAHYFGAAMFGPKGFCPLYELSYKTCNFLCELKLINFSELNLGVLKGLSDEIETGQKLCCLIDMSLRLSARTG
jgi:hypothetical protein